MCYVFVFIFIPLIFAIESKTSSNIIATNIPKNNDTFNTQYKPTPSVCQLHVKFDIQHGITAKRQNILI